MQISININKISVYNGAANIDKDINIISVFYWIANININVNINQYLMANINVFSPITVVTPRLVAAVTESIN